MHRTSLSTISSFDHSPFDQGGRSRPFSFCALFSGIRHSTLGEAGRTNQPFGCTKEAKQLGSLSGDARPRNLWKIGFHDCFIKKNPIRRLVLISGVEPNPAPTFKELLVGHALARVEPKRLYSWMWSSLTSAGSRDIAAPRTAIVLGIRKNRQTLLLLSRFYWTQPGMTLIGRC